MRSIVPLFAVVFAASAPVLATEVVPVPQFRSVELRGGGAVTIVPGSSQRVTILEGTSQITSMRVDHGGKLEIDTCRSGQCPNAYRLRVEIQSVRVPDLAVNGGGLISTSAGFAPQSQLSAAVNGGGKIDARSIEATNVSAAVNGGGELMVRPRGALSAAVNGGGRVRYWGTPSVSSAIRGGGSVGPGY